MPDSLDTVYLRPKNIRRPPDLWRAWERTAGYLAYHDHQNVAISLTWTAEGVDAPWMAQFNWSENLEHASGFPMPGNALVALWDQVEAGHAIFQSPLDAGIAPRDYPPEQWFEEAEHKILERLVQLATKRYNPAATLIIAYQPSALPNARSRARLIGHGSEAAIGGQGNTLVKACRDLYHNTAKQLGIQDTLDQSQM